MSGSIDLDSQNTGYVGRPGFEKKFHQTHFQVGDLNLKDAGAGDYEWVRIAPGRFKRQKRVSTAERSAEVDNGKEGKNL